MDSNHALTGLHHISLVASNAERTVRFYTGVLGLQFVKKTVNFDRPDMYHLYFGDRTGTPGTLVTFFEWPDAAPGRLGVGTTHHFALTVDSFDTLLKWKTWLQHAHLLVAGPYRHQAYQGIIFIDPDGVVLEIATSGPGWQGADDRPDTFIPYHDPAATETWPEPVTEITPDMQLRGLHHVACLCSDIERTTAFFEDGLGIHCLHATADPDVPSAPRRFFSTAAGSDAGRPGTLIIATAPGEGDRPIRGHIGHGMTHHFAFCVASDEGQQYWRARLLQYGVQVTEVLDRKYFRSIYFHDPDGHILEIATAQPGFLVDQPVERLGKDLTLPAWLETDREEIEAKLPRLFV